MTPVAELFNFLGIDTVIASSRMKELLRLAERIAHGEATVLLHGESGAGKEIVARAIHRYSLRANKPWVDINCAALPENLIESELFGHEKGAFSGADSSREGLFELADTGTLFLDEIGDLDPKMQVKLLRVLDKVPYYRLGGRRKITVDVRVLAATNQDLSLAVKRGQFRGDLYHRLSQFKLHIPPLRERPDDIEALARYFLERDHPNLRLTDDALARMRRHPWPGNVRELRNVITSSAVMAMGLQIQASDLVMEPASGAEPPPSEATNLEQLERETILRVLSQTGGHQEKAAGLLGISSRTLSRKLKEYGASSHETCPAER